MNRVTSTERETPQLRGAKRESVVSLGGQTESAVKELSPLIRLPVKHKGGLDWKSPALCGAQ